jgi:hypothetical protein
MLERVDLDGYTVLADKGFVGEEFEQIMASLGARFLRPDRKDEPRRNGSLGPVRQWIESTIWTAKANSRSNATAAAPSPASASVSHCGSSHSQPASPTTKQSVTQAATSPPTPTNSESTI